MGLHQTQIALESIRNENWQNKTFLDIGCSNGILTSKTLEKTGAKSAVGVDFDEKRIEMAKENFAQSENLSFQTADACNLAGFKNEEFDIVISNMAFQQFSNPLAVLKEVYRVLKKGGKAIINFNTEKAPFFAERQKIVNQILGSQNEVTLSKKLHEDDFRKMASECVFSAINIKNEYSTYYFPSIDLAFDNNDRNYFLKEDILNTEQQKMFIQKSEEYLESIKTAQGIPEKWKILSAKLVK